MGILQRNHHDAFFSYAHDDNVIHDDVVRMFRRYFGPKFRAVMRLQVDPVDEPDLFMDTDGLPASGDLTREIEAAIASTVFLVIFVGKAYPSSTWCGRELRRFADRFADKREIALQRTFVIVLDKAAENLNWGEFLESPERPIFVRFYDDDTGRHFAPILEDPTGQAVPGPRFLIGVQNVANTMAERAAAILEARQAENE